MLEFDFPYHKYSTIYPDRGNSLSLGGDWDYSLTPHTKPAKKFRLKFDVLKYFPEGYLGTPHERKIDLGRLEEFYAQHETYRSFLYTHPIHGTVVVRFAKPLEIPEGITSGDGSVANIEVLLQEQLVQ